MGNIKTKQRDSWFDNVKGILMIAVVVGHFNASVIGQYQTLAFLQTVIYFFHMPAFAVISGYFLKRRVNTKDYVSVINKTLIPYLFAQLFVYIAAVILPDGVRALSAERLYESGVFSFLFPIYHLWYFFGVVFSFLFLVYSNAQKHPLRAFVISIALSVVSGMIPTVEFMRFTKVIAFLPFFVFGYIFPKNAMENVRKRKFAVPSAVFVSAVVAFFWFFRTRWTPISIFAMTLRYEKYESVYGISYWQAVIVRVVFIVLSIIFSLAFMNLCPKKKSVFTVLGERSVYIYVLHVIIVAVVRHFNYDYKILQQLNSPVRKIFFLLFGVAVCYALASKPVVAVFKRFFEPSFDIRKIPQYLKQKED